MGGLPCSPTFATDVHVNNKVRFVVTSWSRVNRLTRRLTVQVVSQLHELLARGVVPDGGEVGLARARASRQVSSINRVGSRGETGGGSVLCHGQDRR